MVEEVSSLTSTNCLCVCIVFEWHSAILMPAEIGWTLDSVFEFLKEHLPTKLCCSNRNAVCNCYVCLLICGSLRRGGRTRGEFSAVLAICFDTNTDSSQELREPLFMQHFGRYSDGLQAAWPEFDSLMEFFSWQRVRSCPDTHPASCSVGTEEAIHWGDAA